MKAFWNDVLIAEADQADIISIEGNKYFPPSSVNKDYLVPNDEHTTCFWKGEASYFDVAVNGDINKGAAWYYPEPNPEAITRVKRDFTNYIAFWRGVEVKE